MGDLTKNISRHELACSCGCGFDTMDWETLNVVQEVCDWAAERLDQDKVTLRINSACRCPKHNEAEGGSKNSQHMRARAMDIVIVGLDPALVHQYLTGRFVGKYGIGKYDSFTHIDTRSNGPARW